MPHDQRCSIGQQESTLNWAAFRIGTLVAAGELAADFALAELQAAGNSMRSQKGRLPWRPADINRKIRPALADGTRHRRPSPLLRRFSMTAMHRPFTEDDATAPAVATIDDFYAYMPQHKYICVPTREIWVASGVDGRLPKVGDIKATRWLDLNKPIEQISWAPGETVLIKSRIVSEGGFCEQQGYTCFNGPSSRVVIAAKPDRSTALRGRMMSCRSRINFARELLLPQSRENVKSSRASRYRRQAATVECLDEWF